MKNYLFSRTIDRRIAGIKIVAPVLPPAIGSLQEDLQNRQHCSISQHQSILIFWSQNNLCSQLLNKSPLCVTSEIKEKTSTASQSTEHRHMCDGRFNSTDRQQQILIPRGLSVHGLLACLFHSAFL